MKKIYTRLLAGVLMMASPLTGVAARPSGKAMSMSLMESEVQKTETKLVVNSTLDVASLKNLKSNREVWITPVVRSNETTDSLELPALCLAGHNRYNLLRRTLSSSERDAIIRAGKSAELPIDFTVDYQPWMEDASIVYRTMECGCCNSPIDYGVIDGPKLDFRPRVFEALWAYVKPAAEVKTRSLSGSAYIDFPVNRTELYPDYRRNPAELKAIQKTIDVVRNDPDIRIDSLSVIGFASPEGPWNNNVRLAKGRTATLIGYIRDLYSFSPDILRQGSVPEDWEGLVKHLELTEIANRDAIISIASDRSIEPDLRNSMIQKQFPIQYDWILKNIYPALRHSDYTVFYTVADYTDPAVIGELLHSNPQKLSLEEMFTYANTLEPDSDEFREVFEIAVRMYPDNPIANINAANTALRHGDIESAARYLEKSGDSAEAVYLHGVSAALAGDFATAKPLFEQAAGMGCPQAEEALRQIKERGLDR